MKILVDGWAFQNQFQFGIQRYFRELLSRVADVHEVLLWTPLPSQVELPNRVKVVGPGRERFPSRFDLVGRWKSSKSWQKELRTMKGCHVFHSTYYTQSPLENIPSVVTVFDMIAEEFQIGHPSHVQTKHACMEAAAVVLAISKATAIAIEHTYPEIGHKVRVVHLGADHLPQFLNEPIVRSLSVLYVGDRVGYKNFDTFLDALALKDWPDGVNLRVVGSPFTGVEKSRISSLGVANRILHLGRLNEESLAREYRKCLCFVFPSLQEGFGFPVLEAQSQGAALVCSDIPVFHEIAGDFAEFFDPRDPESILAAVRRAIDPTRNALLVAGGLDNVQRFRWQKCAELTLHAYEDAVMLSRIPS
jgi:glycosyltransferase involved in cell wall biosynthesis